MESQATQTNGTVSYESYGGPMNGSDSPTRPIAPGYGNIQEINDAVQRSGAWVGPLKDELGRVAVGREALLLGHLEQVVERRATQVAVDQQGPTTTAGQTNR